ncbi:hypothetical protein SESBI_45515 [Sesbania bispinosa]|nr:hypothetical protein SESBI_45515 [Sesbania bispinosa]
MADDAIPDRIQGVEYPSTSFGTCRLPSTSKPRCQVGYENTLEQVLMYGA